MKAIEMTEFNAHQFVKELQKAGFEEKKAEAILTVFTKGRESDLEKTVSKDQLELIKQIIESNKTELKKDIETLEHKIDANKIELKKDIETTKQELRVEIQTSMNTVIKWNIGTIIAVVGIVVAILKFLPH